MQSRRDLARARVVGMAYVAVLFLIAMMALAASAAVVVWQIEARREKEQDLLFVGREFARALDGYRALSGRAPQPYPTSLDQLLEDRRGSGLRRELRRIYVDPITGRNDWEFVRNSAGGIVGIRSPSSERPIKLNGFPDDLAGFAGARSYRDWVFGSTAVRVASAAPDAAAAPAADPTAPAQLLSPVQAGDSANTGEPTAAPPPSRVPRGTNWLFPQLGTVDGCNTVLATDTAICNGQTAQFGAKAGEQCMESALVRNAECISGGPLSTLFFRSY